MKRGFIKLYRRIEDCDLYMDDEPFCKRAAWIDLLLMANHKDNFVFQGMSKIVVKRGQRKTSLCKLAERWHWGQRKVKAYLEMLQSEGMIYLEITNRGVLITVVNYGLYQGFLDKDAEQTAEPIAEQTAEQVHTKQHTKQQSRLQTNNNVKNDIKNDIKNDQKNVNKPSALFGFVGTEGGIVYEE